MSKTLVIGASLKPERFSYKAINMLRKCNHEVFALGLKAGKVNEVEIFTDKKQLTDIHTITIYLNPQRQKELYDYIVSLKPQRIIFNPGTENNELKKIATENNIKVVENCTLIMLNTGSY